MDAVEEAVEQPAGKRVTRLSFMLAGRDRKQAERITYTVGPIDSGERIESMWCDISSDFLTITMMVTPKGHAACMARSVDELISTIKKNQPEHPIKSPHSRRNKANRKIDTEEEVAELDEILRTMMAHAESISERMVIFRTIEITGPIELSVYFPDSDKKKLSIANWKRNSRTVF
ncbi:MULTISPECIES: hypothetical protein [Pseudomonas syringae group]|nr:MULTISPECIES: hypothetical protein [Pseudomonas syringae group]KWS92067.1 hypothetical protein AL048_02970 [Pseudomonas syringae pv. castaneae]